MPRYVLVQLLLAALVERATSQAGSLPQPNPKYAHVCGTQIRSKSAWIDVPTYWINVDYAIERAARMHAQLEQTLLPGACAWRVPAVLKSNVHNVVLGDIFFTDKDKPTEMRFRSPSTRMLEIAVMSSHAKAVYMGQQHDPRPDAVFLVLEDDVDLMFFPSVRHRQPGWAISAMTANTFARSQPDDWSFAMLMIITLPLRWKMMHDAWREDGMGTVVRAERVTVDARYGCPNKLWSAGAYLVRGTAAQAMQQLWPATMTRDGEFRINVTRTCWHLRTQLMLAKCTPIFNQSTPGPNFVSDNCMLHYESFGPALTAAEAMQLSIRHGSTPGLPTGKAILRLRTQIRTRTYAATPPLVVSHLSSIDMAHPEDYMVHNRSMGTAREWWEAGTVPDVSSDAAWWEPMGSSVRPRKKEKVVTDLIGPMEQINIAVAMGGGGERRTMEDWRFGLPLLQRGDFTALRFLCRESVAGCRKPAVLGVQAIKPLIDPPKGPNGEAFNLAILELLHTERLLLGHPAAAFLGVLQHGLGQQCTNAPITPTETTVTTSSGTINLAFQKQRQNSLQIVLTGHDMTVIESAVLEMSDEDDHCVGPKAVIRECQLFRYRFPTVQLAQPWMRCICQEWDATSGRVIQDLHSPFVTPIELSRVGGHLRARVIRGEGGLLFSDSFPEGPGGRGRWYGGNNKVNLVMIPHRTELYALWELHPSPVIVQLPPDGPGNEQLARQGDVRGSQCCAQPIGMAFPTGQIFIGALNLGATKLIIHPAAGWVHLPEYKLLLGVAKFSRNLFGIVRRHAHGNKHLPAGATHTTHAFIGLSDTKPFGLTHLGPEWCLPRVGMHKGTLNMSTLDMRDCNVIQTVLSILSERNRTHAHSDTIHISYGVDACSSAVARLPVLIALNLLHPLAAWRHTYGAHATYAPSPGASSSAGGSTGGSAGGRAGGNSASLVPTMASRYGSRADMAPSYAHRYPTRGVGGHGAAAGRAAHRYTYRGGIGQAQGGTVGQHIITRRVHRRSRTDAS
jgi:hypothetical protein